MSKLNKNRSGCIDVFNAFLVEEARYDGDLEYPVIECCNEIPNALVSFSKAVSNKCHDYNKWVHFYEDDYLFERIWNNPKKYFEKLKSFNGVILPDFSMYRDMPLIMQLWNLYRSRAIGNGLNHLGIKTIPNIRFSDERTYSEVCSGILPNRVISIGSHGNIKNKSDRFYFEQGLKYIVDNLSPTTIVVYGKTPDTIFGQFKKAGIQIKTFESDYSTSRKGVE